MSASATQKPAKFTSALEKGVPYIHLCYDIKERVIHVFLQEVDDNMVVDTIASADGQSDASFVLGQDRLPYVVATTIRNANKVGIIQDWIEEAIEASLDNLNVIPSDDFADDHWKGVQTT